MDPKANYFMVGLFVLVLTLGAVGLVLWLGKTDYLDEYNQYRAYMRQSVSGLSVNSTVKYRGVDVGRVREISLNPDNIEEVRLTLDILRNIPIKTDTVATMETQGLTGMAILNLEGGSREAPELEPEPDQPYPVIQTKPSLYYRLDMALSRLLSEEGVFTLLSNLNTFSEQATAMVNEETRAKLDAILDDFSEVSQALAGQSRTIRHSIQTASEAMENLAGLTVQVKRDWPALVKRMEHSSAAVQQVTEDLAETGNTLRMLVRDSRPDLQRFTRETLGETGQLISELRQLTATLQRAARQIERSPDSLIYGRPAQPKGPGE